MFLLNLRNFRRLLQFNTTSSKGHIYKRQCSNVNRSLRKFLFLGSDDFSIGSLEALRDLFQQDSLTVVVSHPNNLVAKFSRLHSLKLISWDELKLETNVDHEQFDIGVVASFGFLIPQNIIRRCRMGILNVHASLLPRWRGASPISHAIMNGDHVTGISIMQIAPHKFDVGPVLLQQEVCIHPHVRAPELKIILTEIGATALKKVLINLDYYQAKAKPQNTLELKGTLAPKVSLEMSQVQWNSKNAVEIYNQYRGMCGFFKLRTNYQDRIIYLDDFAIYSSESDVKPSETNILKLVKPNTDFKAFYSPSVTVRPYTLPNKADIMPGDIYFLNGFLCVKCSSRDSDDPVLNWIFIRKIKVGVKWMSALDFRNGFLTKSKDRKFFYSNNTNVISQRDTV